MINTRAVKRQLLPITAVLCVILVFSLGATLLSREEQIREAETLSEHNFKGVNVKDKTEALSALTQERVEEEIKDGIYTNHTYGFRFEYDEDLFDRYERNGNGQLVFLTEEGEDGLHLNVNTSVSDSERMTWDKSLELCKNGGQDYPLSNVNGCMSNNTSEGYWAYFQVKDEFVVITLWDGANSKGHIKHLSDFEILFNSFKTFQ